MFFQSTEINKLLVCSNCESKFIDIIKHTPCGNSLCIDCYNDIKLTLNEREEFKCKPCGQVHKMPKEGLPDSLLLMKMLNIKPISVYRNQKVRNEKLFYFNFDILVHHK